MEKSKSIKWSIVIIILIILLFVALIFIPFRKNISKDIDIVHYVNSEAVEEGTLSIDGVLTYKVFSNDMTFNGDYSIVKIETDLSYMQVNIPLNKNDYVLTGIVLAGVEANTAINETLGYAAIYGEFEKFVFTQQDPNSNDLILSPEDYWTDAESSADEVFSTVINSN